MSWILLSIPFAIAVLLIAIVPIVLGAFQDQAAAHVETESLDRDKVAV